MLPVLVFQTIAFVLNLILVLFLAYYLITLRKKAKEIDKKEQQIDSEFHHVVDEALSKERQILKDATSEAGHILTDAKYVNQQSTDAVDHALETMIADTKKETAEMSKQLHAKYIASLEQISHASLSDFQQISTNLKNDLAEQLKKFHETLLPTMEKELEAYKQQRLKQTESSISRIVQQAAQEMFNKSLSIEEHQKLLLDSLEKAKKDGMFDG